jgi:hypothetical protein
MPPATRPANAPARRRSVGAAWRTAHIVSAKGTMAMIGIDTRHSSHSSPATIRSQCEAGAEPRLTSASATITRNGRMTSSVPCFGAPPGRDSLVGCRRTGDGCGEGDLQKKECPRADSGKTCAWAKPDQDGSDSKQRSSGNRHGDTAADSPEVHGVDARAQDLNKIVGFHGPFSVSRRPSDGRHAHLSHGALCAASSGQFGIP